MGDGASLTPVGASPSAEESTCDRNTPNGSRTQARTTASDASNANPEEHHPAEAAPKSRRRVTDGRAAATLSGSEADEDLELIKGRVAAHLEAKDRESFFSDECLHSALARLQQRHPAAFMPIRDQLHKLVGKKDLQDLLAPHRSRVPAGGQVDAGRSETTEVAPEDEGRGILYPEVNGWTVIERINPRTGFAQHTDLAPFVARVEEMVLRDDGLEPAVRFRVSGVSHDGTVLPALDLAAAEFTAMEWPLTRWGLHLEALGDAKNHLKAAILKGSDGYPTRRVYTHTGWREVDGRWVYLHAGGAIGPNGADPNVQVALPDRLAFFDLPEPADGESLRQAVRSTIVGLRKLHLPERPGSGAISAVALALPFRAALGPTLFNIWIEGLSGAFKTELAANVLQRFFGPRFHREASPGSWFSTDNALEIQAHAAKDALFLIDDFRPPEGPDRSRYMARASRLLRNATDRSGRDRARVDGSLQSLKYPRGTLLVIAEAGPPPSDQAAIGRTLILKIAADRPADGLVGTLEPEALRRCTDDASAGLYAQAMAGFLRSIAPRYSEIRSGLRKKIDQKAQSIRADLSAAALHHRTPEIVADLLVGLDEFIIFAVEINAISFWESVQLKDCVRKGLIQAGSDQREHHQESDPVSQFLAQLSAALTSGQACLVDRQGQPPAGIEAACGWRKDGVDEWRHAARWKAGWVVEDEVFLHLESAYAAAESVGQFAFDSRTLSRRLKDKGLLRHTEGAGGNTVKRTCEKTIHRVLVLARTTVIPTPEEPVLPETDAGACQSELF